MEKHRCSTTAALGLIEDALASVNASQRAALGHSDLVALMLQARNVAGRVQGLADAVTAEVDRRQSTMHAAGTPLTSLLANAENTDSKDAARSVFEARDVARHPQVADAVMQGTTSVSHARGIAKGMADLPRTLDADQRKQAEVAFLRHARTVTPRELARKAAEVLAEVAPEQVPDAADQARALEEQRRRAVARRSFTFGDDGDGSTWFKGSLPHQDARPLLSLTEAYVAAGRRAVRDSAAGMRSLRPGPKVLREHGGSDLDLTPQQRCADALVKLIADHRGAPQVAGDRPRIVVRMSEADLRARAEQAGLLDDGARISAGELRRMCCDADLMPVVLGAASEILDVGHTQRLVTPSIRRALSERDGGCVFPKCGASDAECEAHHVVPWWDGGDTALGNMALLCPHHHAVVEPDRFGPGGGRDQWSIGFHPRTREPVVHPPRRWRVVSMAMRR
ncbi:DUF222 domain-containing protein [Tessaracoccus sp.]